jgi:hypothetical protein
MQGPDQPKSTTVPGGQADKAQLNKSEAISIVKPVSYPSSPSQVRGFDWTAIGIVILIAAFFALTARLNAQPATSFVPIAVLSATGCGLLVTAIRKLHTPKGTGLFEAALAGFFIAFFQFTVAITYPGVFDTLIQGQLSGHGFLITWGLVAGFSILFSIVGAALGHLAFAPLRPLPASSSQNTSLEEEEVENNNTSLEEQPVDHSGVEEGEEVTGAIADSEDKENTAGSPEELALPVGASEASSPWQPPRSVFSYFVTVLLLGLAPTVAAYVFSAAYDYTLSLNQLIQGPYPTLRLLSTLLPWQVPLPIDINGIIGKIIIFSLLWRIPLFLGNPTLFDLQALETYVFNGAALGLLLLTMYRHNIGAAHRSSPPGWLAYLSLEALLGLVIVLPASLWALRGLEGLLQFRDIVIPIRTLSILNPLTFSLNLITGPLVCIIIGIVLRRYLMKSNSTKAQLR